MMDIILPFILLFVPVLLVFGIIEYVSYRKWTSVLITFNDEDYFRAIGKLNQVGIKYRTKSIFNQTSTPMFGGNRQMQYEIFVKEQDVPIAFQKLNSN
ncbi:hypothetical protein RCG19_08105 [Neobacillus sp. OS1-2]|uniref:hypothetical protein n=1 Tax=Neobacillus sp. OS1-2 TaxID=3070680 RepID=UPI0027E06B03|nr:hypothetical protein [Neobacillus sp. OS1-2]WML41600.1 hypothetical protein RCG19_08105 [Neobacillus sp. OS1-2]